MAKVKAKKKAKVSTKKYTNAMLRKTIKLMLSDIESLKAAKVQYKSEAIHHLDDIAILRDDVGILNEEISRLHGIIEKRDLRIVELMEEALVSEETDKDLRNRLEAAQQRINYLRLPWYKKIKFI